MVTAQGPLWNGSSGGICTPTDPGEHAILADDEAFVRNIAQHPVIEHHRLTRDGTPRTFSDFYTRAEWHSTGLYNEFFRPLSIETQVGMLFYGPTPAIVGATLNGERKDFSARDRLVLDLIRPHLGRAFESALARASHDRRLAALESGAERAGASIVILTPDRRIDAASKGARRLLRAFFGAPERADALPDDLDRWIRTDPAGVLAKERGGRTLSVRLMPHRTPAEPDALVLEHAPPAPSPENLRGLGLTNREREVLALIAAGRTNGEIAGELTISPLTAKKHAENIYAKLGTPGRAAAAARAQQAVSAAPTAR